MGADQEDVSGMIPETRSRIRGCLPYTEPIVLSGQRPEWRPGRSETLMPEMADKAECAFTLGVTRDKPNCGHPRYKSVNKSTSYNSAFTGTVFQETKL